MYVCLYDNEDIRRPLRWFMEGLTCCYVPSELVHIQRIFLFMSYCGSLYTSSIWCRYTKNQYYRMEVAYNDIFRRFFGYDRFSSASQMFVENRVENFETRVRRRIYGFRETLNASWNSLVICLMNSVAWSSSELPRKRENIYICSHELTPNFFNPCDTLCKMLVMIFFYWMLSATVHCMLSLCISHMYLFLFFFTILHYHCIYYVFKYGILCISLHVLWKPTKNIYYNYYHCMKVNWQWGQVGWMLANHGDGLSSSCF